MRNVLIWSLLVLACLGAAVPAPGQEAFFEEGNRLYQEGEYERALESYLRIVDAGLESGALYYNIGNSYFKLGELGSAILYYERAQRLLPRDADIRANLQLARSLTADEVTPLGDFWLFDVIRWWVHLIPHSWLVVLVGVGYLIVMAALTVSILKRGTAIADALRPVTIATAVVTTMLAINLAVLELRIAQPREAIIMADEVSVQSAPSEDRALQVFAIHEGTKVRIDRQSDEWVEIVLEDGKVGWVRVDVLEEI